ncbi:MAG: hypothetical protein NDI69_11245 [Bacteriovoracaceae bacterium]|nr:hypothetical protein [Bacteriovoracaceae bacterium]
MKGHDKLYAEPDAPTLIELEPHEKRLVIASTNDVHGNYRPELVSFKDEHQKDSQYTRIGGVDVINNYFKILRQTYSNVVLVDSGDIFSNAGQISMTREFYSFLKYDALTVGLRDFNLKVPAQIGKSSDMFQNFAMASDVPLIMSNLYDLKTARGVEWKGTKSHHIKDIAGIRVGIIGLIPDDIVNQTPVNNRVGLFVENMLQSTLRHARLLRSLGADLIVVLSHQGLDCYSELSAKEKLSPLKVNFEPTAEGVCETQSVLGQFLERLPPHLVDVVIGGRNHQKMANYVNGTLVMSGFPDGKSFNYAELVIDTKTNKIVQEKSVVHQPVFFCHDFFKTTNDCFTEDTSVNHKERIPATFLGKPIERDLSLEKKFPGLSGDKTALHQHTINVPQSLAFFKADISFVPQNSGETQLYIIVMKGRDLLRILEEEYNLNRKDLWQPSPFAFDNSELTITISGNELKMDGEYRVLTDLESLQNHYSLLNHFGKLKSEALANFSWKSVTAEDSVTSTLAAQTR